jgi:hypothetical protein
MLGRFRALLAGNVTQPLVLADAAATMDLDAGNRALHFDRWRHF